MKVQSLSDVPGRFAPGARMLLNGRFITVERVAHGKGILLLKLTGINTREAAAQHKGDYLEVPEAEVAALPQGQFYHYQVLGLEVFTTDGRRLGPIVRILPYPSNDVYVVRWGDREVLVPAIADVVKEVDAKQGRMTIHALPGLL